MADVKRGYRASAVSLAANPLLAAVKIVAGVLGHSHALVADGIESCADVFSSLVVWKAFRVSRKPPDEGHPYGHGKAESLAAILVVAALLLAATLIGYQSVREIVTPHSSPEPFTLVVLVVVIVVKEGLFRYVNRTGRELGSTALRGDAWHHRSDALTSMAAFVGISIALAGGEGYETADDWAALVACLVIVWNGFLLLRPAVAEVMDASVSREVEDDVRSIASSVGGVMMIEKCRVRKSGLGLLMDIHVVVDGSIPVRDGHEIGHRVKDKLIESYLPVEDVVVHIEPDSK